MFKNIRGRGGEDVLFDLELNRPPSGRLPSNLSPDGAIRAQAVKWNHPPANLDGQPDLNRRHRVGRIKGGGKRRDPVLIE